MKKQDTMGSLVEMNENQLYPRMAKPEDFGPKPPAPVPSGPMGLVDDDGNLGCPRHAEDDGAGKSGAGTPSDNRTAAVARNFKSQQNSAESGTSVKMDLWVDLKDGQHPCCVTGKA
jgi:hypothetical protein